MKNSILIAIIILQALVFQSCTKEIELEPTHTVDGDLAFDKIEDYEFALTGAYAALLSVNYYGSSNGSNAFVTLSDMMTDNFYESNESLNNYQNFTRWNYTADDLNIEATWLAAYRVIQQCNLTLRNIDRLAGENPGGVNRVKAQALALRAFVHFDILRYWGEGTEFNSTLKGIPYVTVFDIEQNPTRPTVAETYESIINDLDSAGSLVQNMDRPIQSATSTSPTARAYIDEIVINAMKARIYHYASVPDSAIKYASLVIGERPLATRDEFPLIWQDAGTVEVIWSAKMNQLNSGPGDNIYYPVGNRASYRPTLNLLSLYDQANDIRYSSYFKAIGSATRIVLIKYLAKQPQLTQPDGITDFKVLRTGEMYLIRSEAYYQLGLQDLALNDLNLLRSVRIEGFAPGTESGAMLLQAIQNERRKELVAEGHRWFDLKRTSRLVNRTTNCSSFCQLEPTAREWAWPIPQTEILANPNISQTSGY